MGIDYSSHVGYGFRVDLEKLKAYDPEGSEEAEAWDVLDEYVYGSEKRRALLSSITAGPYDASDEETDFAIVAKSSLEETASYDGAFGVFMFANIPEPTHEERKALEKAHKKLGTGFIGPLAAFDCS